MIHQKKKKKELRNTALTDDSSLKMHMLRGHEINKLPLQLKRVVFVIHV